MTGPTPPRRSMDAILPGHGGSQGAAGPLRGGPSGPPLTPASAPGERSAMGSAGTPDRAAQDAIVAELVDRVCDDAERAVRLRKD